MKRFISILILVLLNGALCLAQSQKAKSDSTQEAKTAQAEKAATRFLRRFNETKNFAVVYREFFVKDKSLRLQEAKRYAWGIIDENLIEKLDDVTLEQFYVSLLDTMYLSFFYILNRKDYGSDEKTDLTLMTLWFSVLSQWASNLNVKDDNELKVMLLPLLPFINCNKCNVFSLETKKQVEEYIPLMNFFAHQVRGRIPRNPAYTKLYKKNVKNIIWNDRATYVEDGEEYFGIPKNKKVYHISRGIFRLVWIEENGQFKVVAPILSD